MTAETDIQGISLIVGATKPSARVLFPEDEGEGGNTYTHVFFAETLVEPDRL